MANGTGKSQTKGRRSRRVLMVAAAFPPTGGSGVQRTLKFAKYLPQFGWSPTVWTCDAIDAMPRDESMLSDIPSEAVVHRRRDESYVQDARRLSRRFIRAGGACARIGTAIDWRLERWMARKPMPDPFITWAQASLKPLLALVKRERIDVIYSTFSPASNHWLGLKLKRSTGLPWLADFRDLWTDDYRYVEPSVTRQRAHRLLQQEILEAADVVLGVTEGQTAILARHLPAQEEKFVTITNGFDPADFENIKPAMTGDSDRFVLAHVGRFDRWRTHDAWFSGLKLFVDRAGHPKKRFVLRIVGHVSRTTLNRLQATGVVCEATGQVDHRQAVTEMASADALLLSVPDGPNAKTVIPAKLFEYLASGRPILTVGPQGGICEPIVQACEAGLCVNFDAPQIACALHQLLDDGPRHGAGRMDPHQRSERIGAYSRVALTSRLADLLNRSAVPPRQSGIHLPYVQADIQ